MKIEVEGYRCFSEPIEFEIGDGITAFVGPNNAGKSTVLRIFYELRPILQQCTGETFLRALDRGQQLTTRPQGDTYVNWEELFSDSSEGPLSLRIGLDTPTKDEPALIEIRIERSGDCKTRVFADEEWWPGPQRGVTTSSSNDAVNVKDRARPLTRYFEEMASLADAMYAGPERNLWGTSMGSNPSDLDTGETFVSKWSELKGGGRRRSRQLMYSVVEDICGAFGFERLEVNVTDDSKSLELLVDGRSYLLQELGSGLAQFIIVLANAALRSPDYILIDEPETSLHPSLQHKLVSSLEAYAGRGVAMATHSLGLTHLAAERTYVVSEGNRGSVVQRVERDTRLPEQLGEIGFAAYRALGYQDVLLVEGPTDVRTYQQFLRLLGLERGIVVMDLGGGSNVSPKRAAELREIMEMTPRVHVVVDSERTKEGQQVPKVRRQFLQLCEDLGIRAMATERRATENYLTGEALRAEIGDTASALGPYDKLSGDWGKSENWTIARRMSPSDLRQTDIGEFLGGIGSA